MKNFIFFLAFSLTIGGTIYGQETVPKDVLLTTLNSVNNLKLSNLKTSELMEYNKSYVDKVYDITESDKSDKDKITALRTLGNDTKKDLTDLLGKSTYKKYVKLMKKNFKPLTKKSRLLKYLYS